MAARTSGMQYTRACIQAIGESAEDILSCFKDIGTSTGCQMIT